MKPTITGTALRFAISVCLLGPPATAAAAPDGDHNHPPPAQGSSPATARWSREPSEGCTTAQTPIEVKSEEALRVAGLRFVQVQAAPFTRTIERNAEVAFNANRYARLSSRAPGVVAEVLKDLGERVEKGEPLATIDSTELGAAKADLLQAIETVNLWEANAARENALVEKGAGIEREALEARTRLSEGRISLSRARQRLRNYGLSKDQIDAIEHDADTSSLLQLVAPFSGTVVERTAVIGELVDHARQLLAVADTSIMWAMVDLSEGDLALVRTGQAATLRADGLPGESFTGRVTWISPQVDPRTRTVKARVELENPQGLLRANMFGRVSISAGSPTQALRVPKEAVQWEGCCNIAFVRPSPDALTFLPARLTLGFDAGDSYEVLAGLKPGDTIVTAGSFVLKNELLKSAVGTGCCEIEHLDK